MGHHYIPQAYLRAFQDPSAHGMIWMYDKRDRCFRHASIKTVAQQADYYDEEDERELNDQVEGPSHVVFQKLREGRRLDMADREVLEMYVGTMLMRVPRRRRKAVELIPKVAQDVFENIAKEFVELAEARSADSELVSRRLSELERLRDEYQKNPPQDILDRIRDPWPSERIMAALVPMTWWIVSAGHGHRFITSDNPAFFFESDGLASEKSELTFPLTSDFALAASWQGAHRQTHYAGARPAVVKEINRRAATSAERFVFCHAPLRWIDPVSRKAKPFISRIDWNR